MFLARRALLKQIPLAAGWIALAGCSPAPRVDLAAETSAVRQRYADWTAAEKRRDLAAAIDYLASDVILQGEGSPAVQGTEAARKVWEEFFRLPYTDIVDTVPRTVTVAQSGDMATDTGSWKLVLPSPLGPTDAFGKSLVVWRKQAGQWKVSAYSYSMDAPLTK